MFVLGSDLNSDLDINSSTIDENGDPVQVDDPGAIFNPFLQGPSWEAAMSLGGAPGQPPPPCQKQRNASPATYDFVQNNYNDASTLATLMGTTAANVLGLSSVESGNGSSNLAVHYNNYFGLTYPFPGSGAAYHSPNGYSYSTYGSPGFWNSGVSFMRSRQGTRVGGSLTPQSFATSLTTAPMAFNSEPGRYQIYVNRINIVQADIDCLFGPGH